MSMPNDSVETTERAATDVMPTANDSFKTTGIPIRFDGDKKSCAIEKSSIWASEIIFI